MNHPQMDSIICRAKAILREAGSTTEAARLTSLGYSAISGQLDVLVERMLVHERRVKAGFDAIVSKRIALANLADEAKEAEG